MANTILMASRQTDATVPGATALKVGELAVNTYDSRVYLGTDLSGSSSRPAGGAATASTWIGGNIKDEDNMSSDSATALATQQSIKAYVDSNAGTGDITGVTAGDGLSGGGSSGAVTVTLDLNELGTETSIAQADFIAMVDATDSGSEKITFSNLEDAIFGNVSGDATVAAGGALTIAAGAVENSMLADDAVDSDELAAGAVDNAHMAANSVDSDQYVDGSIDLAHMSANSIDSDQYVDGSIDLAHMSANSVDSDQYVDGSVDNVHLANDGITISGTDTSLGGTITFPTMSNVDMGGDFVIGNQSDDTCTITGNLTVAGTTTTTQTIAVGVSDTIVFEGSSANNYETTLTVTNPTADRTITLPNVTGTVITTGDSATVTAAMLASNSVDSSELVDGSIDLSHMSANSVDSDQYVDGSIDNAHLADDAVNSDEIAAGAIDLAHMSVNSVDSDQYVDGSIDLVHMSANSVDSDQYVDGSIDLAHMSANSVDSDQYVDGSVDNVHLANSSITMAGTAYALGSSGFTAAVIAAAIDSETMTLTNTTISGGEYSTT